MSKNQYDVIVIGSGMGGLTAAVELASQGARVLVLEQHYLLGGACTTYTRKGGYLFDAGVESISGLGERGPVHHFLRKHNLWDRLVWLRNQYEFQYQGKVFVIPTSWEAWRDQLIERYPHEGKGLKGFFMTCKKAYEQMYYSFAPDRVTPYEPQSLAEKLAYPIKHPQFFRWMKRTWGELLQNFVQDPGLHAQLSMLTGYVGDAGKDTPAASMLALMGYFIDGGFRPQGGSGELAKQLVQKLREYGGEAKIHVDVKSILIENNRIIGVESNRGRFEAPIVISNVDPRVTYEQLIDPNHLPPQILANAQALQPSMSLYIWSAALTRPFVSDRLTFVHLDTPVELPLNNLRVTSYTYQSASAVDSTLVPEGAGSVAINLRAKPLATHYRAMSEDQYQACKKELDDFCRTLIAQIDPDTASSILFSEVSTPKTVQHFMRTYEGSIYSSKINKSIQFPNITTPINGLFLTGAGVGYGPGIEAVVITGAATAEQVLSYRGSELFARQN
ncbi:phytoene desaturase family protein [Brevibacillus ginsengisoli]|uniref:phytoene desaturase family protein n=1 Tax=Brevibacillus ginsengisoli TaxID=363854 RepID=UPI003CF39FF0